MNIDRMDRTVLALARFSAYARLAGELRLRNCGIAPLLAYRVDRSIVSRGIVRRKSDVIPEKLNKQLDCPVNRFASNSTQLRTALFNFDFRPFYRDLRLCNK